MKKIKKIEPKIIAKFESGECVCLGSHINELIDALNTHLERHKECDKWLDRRLENDDMRLDRLEAEVEPKQECDGSKIYPGQVGSGDTGENSGLGVGSGYDGSKPKQECTCKYPTPDADETYCCYCFKSLPTNTKEEVNYFDDKHQCKKCKGWVQDGAIICHHCEQHDP
jgi:hypothetical protein